MKRIITVAMVLVMMLASIGGCWPWWYEDGRGERGGGHGGDRGHEEHHGHGERR